RLVMALVRRERQPARALTRIIELALARKIKPREPILRVGIAEIGGGVGIHIARALDIGLHVGIRDAALIVGADRDESVGNETRLRTVRRDVGVVGSELREIVKRLEVVLLHAVALGIHAAELPGGERVAVVGGVTELFHRPLLFAREIGLRAGTERLEGAVRRRKTGLGRERRRRD